MKTFLHKIWCGDITPGSEPTSNSADIAELMQYKSRHRDRLLATLSEEQANIFTDYEACEQERDWLTQEDAFTEGIRYAVRFLVAALG